MALYGSYFKKLELTLKTNQFTLSATVQLFSSITFSVKMRPEMERSFENMYSV